MGKALCGLIFGVMFITLLFSAINQDWFAMILAFIVMGLYGHEFQKKNGGDLNNLPNIALCGTNAFLAILLAVYGQIGIALLLGGISGLSWFAYEVKEKMKHASVPVKK